MEATLAALREIGKAVKENIDLIPTPEEKGRDIEMGADGTPTAVIDKVAENTVLDYVVRNGLDLNVLSEEIGFVDNGARETMVLDPIDGSHNAVAGVPLYTVSMAVGKKKLSDVRLAYLYMPATGDEYWAEKGKGAFKNGKRIHVRAPDESSLRMMIYTGNGADHSAWDLAKRVKSCRSYGCSSLEMSYVAEGSADGFYMNSERYTRAIRVVDIAASYLILKEAGGYIFTLEGADFDMPFNLETRGNFIAVSDPSLYDFITEKHVMSDLGRTYGIVANPRVEGVKGYVERVVASLDGAKLVFDKSAAKILGKKGGKAIADIKADALITVGGDGTILRTLHENSAPVLGINAGGVGFLTALETSQIEEGMERLKRGDYTVEERFKIDCVMDGKIVERAVNEAVVHSDSIAKIRKFRIYVDDRLATEVRADGVIISTPTGSTSYAMSLGAPVVDPRVDAFVIVPMAAYKFSSRPIVVPSGSKIDVECVLVDKGCLLVVDGFPEHPVPGGSRLTFVRSSRKFRIIGFDRDFYKSLTEKLVNNQ
ncbi:MAG: inositol monophosphatase family protein [Methanomethylophilus sp.]|jgi:NAD+ kinase